MAARENQGLQFALIIFVVLTIMLSVATFMFFSKYDEERNKIAGYEKAAQDADKKADESLTEAKELKAILGVNATDTLKTIQEAKKKDFESMAAGLGDEKQNYRDLARQLAATLAQKQADIIAASDREKKLGDKIKVDETVKVGEIKEYKDTVDKTAADYAGERGLLKGEMDKSALAKTDAEKKFTDGRKEFDDQLKKLKSEIQDRDTNIVKLSQVIERQKEQLLKEVTDFEVADGRVQWVNQGEQLVWVDKGSSDGLRQQVSFKVIDRDEPNPATAATKGTIEVIRVTNGHTAEARIISDDPTNPIMPGDLLFSTVWQAGRIERFALAGFMDINGDLLSDRDLIKQLITLNRGVIDSEVTDDGKRVGELTVATKYLVMGDRPTDKNVKPDMIKNYGWTIEQAEKLGVRVMPVSKFLDHIGYTAQQKTVSLDAGGSSSDFKATLPDVPRRSLGKTIDYSPIRPKSKKTTY